MNWIERGLCIWAVAVVVFVALWIAAHGGIRDDRNELR